MDYSALRKFCTENRIPLTQDVPLSPLCTMRVGGRCDLMASPRSEEALAALYSLCVKEHIPFFILGRGSNVLFPDEGYHGCIISVEALCAVHADGCIITAGAGAALSGVCRAALEHSLSGLEFAYGIPGSVGGALVMNAGAYGGEIKDVVLSCRCADENGVIHELTRDELRLSYRHSVFSEKGGCILSARFALTKGDPAQIKARMSELMGRRRDKQPLDLPSCGSTFKRPEGYFAAALIEECGLKGYAVGGAQVSEKHSGFVVNRGGATARDIMQLVEHIKKTVREEKGVELECEMLIVDGKRR